MNFATLLLMFWQDNPPLPTVGWFDIIWMLIEISLVLAFVCGLAILVFRYILPRLNVVSFEKSIVRVIDTTSIDARKRLMVVETAGKYMLLAVSESGIDLVSELDGEEVEKAVTDLAQVKKSSAKDSFANVIERFRQK